MSIPFLSDIILKKGNKIQFTTDAGANAGAIDIDSSGNLVLSNTAGDVLLGDGAADIYIGDGSNNVDILFEQSGNIKADDSATNVTLTLGSSNTTLNLVSPNITGSLTLPATTINNKLTFGTANGFILFDYEPSGDTGEYSTEVPLIKVDRSGEESTILARISEYRGVALGIDDTTWIRAGDTSSVIRANVNLASEQVLMSAEQGFHAYAFPNNDTTWSNRNEFRFYGGSSTASDNGLYIGDGGNTQFIDLSRNLKNIGNITLTGDISTPGQINLPGDGTTASFETLIYAHGSRAKLMKQGNAVLWQVAQGGNQFEITDAANGNSAKGNVLLRASGLDADDNKLILVPSGGTVEASGNITATASNATISAAESGGATTKIMGASVGRVGTSSNHNLEILSNNTAAITLDTSQNATFAGSITGKDSGIIIDSISGPYGRIHGTSSIFLGGSSTTQVQLSAVLMPDADSTRSLGSSSRYWSHGYIDAITTTGNITVGGNVSVGNDLYVPNEIYHTGDTDTYIQFPAANQFRINTGGGNRLQVQNDKILVGDDVNMQYDGISTGNSGTVVYGGFLNPASEANMVHIPHIINDLAGFNRWSNATITTSGFYKSRSGSSGSYTYSNEVQANDSGWANAFDSHSSTAGSWYSDNGSDGIYQHGTDTPGVVELEWTNEATYSLWAGIVFGSGSFTATYVKIEAYRGGAWQTLCEITDNTDQVVLRQVGSNSGTGAATTRLKYTLGGSVNNNYFRIHSLYMANYRAGDNNLNNTGTDTTRGVNFLERYKDGYLHGHLRPGKDDTYDLGSSSYKWKDAYFDGVVTSDRVQSEGVFPQQFIIDAPNGGGASRTMQVGMSGSSMYFKKSDTTGSVIFRNSNNTNLLNIGLADTGQVTVLNELEAGSLDINGNADISGTLSVGQTTINSGSDNIFTLNQTSTDNKWNYIDFKNQGTREWFIGQDSSGNFDLYNDNINAYAITVGYTNNHINLKANTVVEGTLDANTLNTGQGDNELYAMNQNVRTTDDVTFDNLTVTGNLSITGDINSYNVTDLDVTDKTITVGAGQNAANSGSSGLIIDRSDSTNPSLLWNQTDGRFEFNSGVTVTGQLHTTGSMFAKGALYVVDTDGTNNHIQARSNGTEGFLTVSNGSNWGLIMRGPSNDPRIGAYYGGTLKIEGFHSSDGATGANAVDFAQFQFGNDHFLVNAASNRFTGLVGIKTPSSYTANTSADDLVVGSGSGNQGITIYSGDTSSGSIYFADDLDEEGANDSPAGNRDGVIQYSHNNSEFNFKTGGNQQALELKNTSATFTGNIELASSKRIRWGAGDAQIEEGSTANYSLDFSTYDGSNMTKALTLLSNNNATFTGSIVVAGTVDGVDIAARDAVLTSTTTTANAALPKAGGTMTGDLTITHASTPRINITDTTNDVDFRIRAANSYVYIEADTDNDADSTRIQFKVDDVLIHEYLPSSQIAHQNLTIRREHATSKAVLDLATRKDHTGSGNFTTGDDIGAINFRARDSVVTSDLTVGQLLLEADNTFTSSDKKSRMKMQVYTGSSLETALLIDSDKSATFYGNIIKSGGTSSQFLKADGSVDSNTYLTDHPNISAESSSNNSGRTYIQDITLDSNGHVTGIATATETVTNTNTQLSNSEVISAIVESVNIGQDDRTSIRSNIGAGTSSLQLGTTSSTALAGNTNTISSAQEQKLGYITVTQAVDLDDIETKAALGNTAYGYGNHADQGYLTSSSTQSKYLRSDTADTAGGNITFSDDVELRLGSSAEFRMEHNSSGNTIFRNDKNGGTVYFQSDNSSGTTQNCIIWGGSGSSVELRYNNANRLLTTTNGVELNGSITLNNKLELSYSSTSGSQFEQASSSVVTYRVNSDRFRIWMGGTSGSNETFTVAESGRVGINDSTPDYTLDVSGNVSNISIYASHDVAAYSDARVKTDIETIPNALDKVNKLRGVTFVRTDEGSTDKRMMGVIAQEVKDILPEVVNERESDGHYSVSYGNMVGVLIEAVKELTAEVEALKKCGKCDNCNCKNK